MMEWRACTVKHQDDGSRKRELARARWAKKGDVREVGCTAKNRFKPLLWRRVFEGWAVALHDRYPGLV